jgi:hypothetical protein
MTTEQMLGLLLLVFAYSGITLFVAILEAVRYYRLKKAAAEQPTTLLGVVAPPKRKRD